jgi:hypothetical protein
VENILTALRHSKEEVNYPDLILKGFATAWAAVKIGLLILTVYFIIFQVKSFHETLPYPMKVTDVKKQLTVQQKELVTVLKKLNCPESKRDSIIKAILLGASQIKIDPLLIATLMYTESQFKLNAVSPKGYKSLMQTPKASMEYADVDTLYGCRVLEEKLKIANGNLELALTYYKGSLRATSANGKPSFGNKQAREVIALYNKLRKEIRGA